MVASVLHASITTGGLSCHLAVQMQLIVVAIGLAVSIGLWQVVLAIVSSAIALKVVCPHVAKESITN